MTSWVMCSQTTRSAGGQTDSACVISYTVEPRLTETPQQWTPTI